MDVKGRAGHTSNVVKCIWGDKVYMDVRGRTGHTLEMLRKVFGDRGKSYIDVSRRSLFYVISISFCPKTRLGLKFLKKYQFVYKFSQWHIAAFLF